MAEEGIPFLLSLRDQMTAPIKQIKGALDAAKIATRGLDSQILSLSKSQADFAAKGGKATAKLLGDQIKQLRMQKAEWAHIAAPFKDHVKETERANKAGKEQSGWGKAGTSLLGQFAPKVKETAANMGEMGMAAGLASGGATLAVEAVGKLLDAVKELAVGLIDATKKLIEFTSASAAMREKQVANFTIMRKNAVEGRQTYDMLANIAARQHVSQEKTFEVGKELLAAGVKPNLELQKSVKAITELSKAGTEEQASKLKGIITRSAGTRFGGMGGKGLAGSFSISGQELTEIGLSWKEYTDQLSKQMGKTVTVQDIQLGRIRVSSAMGIAAIQDAVSGGKIGKTAAGMFGGLDQVSQRFKDTLTNLFADVNTGPLMQALHELIDIFDPLTANGANAKTGITNAMNGIIKIAAKVVHELTLGFLKMENELLRVYLYTIPAINGFKKLWATHDGLGKLKMLLKGVAIIMAVLAITTLIAFLPLILLIGTLVAVVVALALGLGWLSEVVGDLPDKFKEWGKEGGKAAKDLVDGLVKGVKDGVKGLVKAVEDLGGSAIKALKKVLGISSPSKEFAKLGRFSAEGFNEGFNIKAGAGLKIGSPAGIKPAGGGGGGATTILLGGVTINIDGSKNPQETAHQLETQFADIIDNALLERGE